MLNIIKIANKNASIPELHSSLNSTLFGPTRPKQVLATRLRGWIKSKADFCSVQGSPIIRFSNAGSCAVEKFMTQVAFIQIFTYGKPIWEISQPAEDTATEKFRISLQSIPPSEPLTDSFQYALSSEKVFSSSNKVYVYGNTASEGKPGRKLADKDPSWNANPKNLNIFFKVFFFKPRIYTDRGIAFQIHKFF